MSVFVDRVTGCVVTGKTKVRPTEIYLEVTDGYLRAATPDKDVVVQFPYKPAKDLIAQYEEVKLNGTK